MEKYELQCSIQDAEGQVVDLRDQIKDYQRKIMIYQKDSAKLAEMYENMEGGYKRKQKDIDLVRTRAKGTAISSYITYLDELYGYEEWRKASVFFENMEETIQDNIRQVENKIVELQNQIVILNNNIYGWQNEVYQLERQAEACGTTRERASERRATGRGGR